MSESGHSRCQTNVASIPEEVLYGLMNEINGSSVSAVFHEALCQRQLAFPETLRADRQSQHVPRPNDASLNDALGFFFYLFTRTFKSRDIVLLRCDLQILCDRLLELAEGLFDGGGLVDAVDGGGLKLLGFTEGLQSCCEAPAV